MKLILLLHVMLAIVFSSCSFFTKKDDLPAFIPGTYVSEWSSEFAESRDTLQIQLAASAGSETYQITRRTYHRYSQDTKPLPPQYKIDKWTASYAPREKILLIHRNGRVLSFDTDNHTMKMGVTIYKKL